MNTESVLPCGCTRGLPCPDDDPMPIFDTVEIDNDGHCGIQHVCCVECRCEVFARFTLAGEWRAGIECPHCLDILTGWKQ